MKNMFLIPIIMGGSVFTLLGQGEKEIKAPIIHVTVYPDRAQVSHEATVDIPAGNTSLRLFPFSAGQEQAGTTRLSRARYSRCSNTMSMGSGIDSTASEPRYHKTAKEKTPHLRARARAV